VKHTSGLDGGQIVKLIGEVALVKLANATDAVQCDSYFTRIR
jgi:hypothetical protein